MSPAVLRRSKIERSCGRIGPLARTLYFLATFQVVCDYLNHVPSYIHLLRYENGMDRMPFQGRLLMVFPLRWAHHNAVLIAAVAVVKKLAPWFLPHITPELLLEFPIDMACIAVTGAVAIRIYRASSKQKLLTLWIYPMVLVMCTAAYLLNSVQDLRYVYDFPSLMFFSVGLYLIYFRCHPALFAACFLVGTVNRETTVFLLFLFVLAQTVEDGRADWKRLLHPRVWAVVLSLGLAWLLWRVWVERLFAQNASELHWHLFLNTGLFLQPLAWPQMASVCGYVLPVIYLFRRSIHDPVLRLWLWVLPAWFAVMFCYGILVETRIFGELIGYLACLTALIAEQAILAALERGGWSRPDDSSSTPHRGSSVEDLAAVCIQYR